MGKMRSLAIITAVMGVFAYSAGSALADGISIQRLPDSSTLEGNVTVTDQDSACDPTFDYCGWYGEASEYPVSVNDAETGGNCPEYSTLRVESGSATRSMTRPAATANRSRFSPTQRAGRSRSAFTRPTRSGATCSTPQAFSLFPKRAQR